MIPAKGAPTRVFFAKESDCRENPSGFDTRATLVPADVRLYLDAGYEVLVEAGLGSGVGFPDRFYQLEGATLVARDAGYQQANLAVKLKGPQVEQINQLRDGAVLFTMAHLYCFPDRLAALESRGTDVVAMELVTAPAAFGTRYFDGYRAAYDARQCVKGPVNIVFEGAEIDTEFVKGFIRGSLRNDPSHLTVTPEPTGDSEEPYVRILSGDRCLLIDGKITSRLPSVVREDPPSLIDQFAFELSRPGRGIGRVHEVGYGGAFYGLRESQRRGKDHPRTVLVGYGNVSLGAINCLLNERIGFTVLGRADTEPQRLREWLSASDLIINGAEDPASEGFIITNEHASQTPSDSVTIDLIGGSPYKRSPVEPFEWTTFLPNMGFDVEGRHFAGLWGWDMYYSMSKTTEQYSQLIARILTADNRYATDVATFTDDYSYARAPEL